MKKVGIVTLNGYINYGNRLQNYALKCFLEDIGVTVETVNYMSLKDIKRNIKTKITISKEDKLKYKKLKKFSQKYLNTIFYFKLEKIHTHYDYLIVGSDQVWNYNFASVNKDMTLLKYSPKEKNISYAASFGISKIKDSVKEEYKKYLSNFKSVSVREESGKQILQDLKIKSEVLVDPTMLLSKEEWEQIIVKPKNIPEKYILTYFLGKQDKKIKDDLKKFAKQNNAKIINILDKDSEFYSLSPEEFLYLEKNAFLVCTDSFHACVFAVLFDTPFTVYERNDNEEKMYTRIEQLLSLLKLKDKTYKGRLTADNLNKDYNESHKILKIEKEKAKDYLKKSMDI